MMKSKLKGYKDYSKKTLYTELISDLDFLSSDHPNLLNSN